MKLKISFILFAALLIAGCATKNANQAAPTVIPTVLTDKSIISEGRLEPVHFADIGFNVGGLVSDVLVSEGDPVDADQIIARLDNSQAETLSAAQAKALKDLTNAYEAVREAQYKLDHFDPPGDLRGLTPEAAVEKTLADLEQARKDYEPFKYITKGNKNAGYFKKRLDDAWEEYHAAVNWMEMDANLETAKSDLEQRKSDYAALQTDGNPEAAAGVRAALANAELRAPFAGTIAKLDIKPSEFATAGQQVVTVADFSTWLVKTTDLTELDVVNVKEGQPVTVTLDAIPEKSLTGKVQSISKTYAEKQGDITYTVTIELANVDARMRWGMTAKVKFASQ